MFKIILLFVMVSNVACAFKGRVQATPHDINIVSVYDGDTIKVDVSNTPDVLGKNLSIRIYGIDTPEIRTTNDCEKQKAIKARDFLADIIDLADTITIQDCSRGKYFRLICVVFVNQYNIAELMIEKKFAIEYYGGARNYEWCDA